MAPWTTSSQPNGEFLLKWVSRNNKDILFGGVDSVGKGYYKNGHDDLQVSSFLWEHKFNDNFHTITEMYYIWQRNALAGGTVDQRAAPALLHRASAPASSSRTVRLARHRQLHRLQAQRQGPARAFGPTSSTTSRASGSASRRPISSTLSAVAHYFYDWLVFRPEIRLDYTSGAKAIDNGTRRDMFTFSADLIIRF